MKVFQSLKDSELPSEYLISRIRGKRSRLIADWSLPLSSADPLEFIHSPHYKGFVTEKSREGIRRSLMREFRWVYSHMNRSLRKIFGPFFLLSELRTLFAVLRHIKGGERSGFHDLFAYSLLSHEIRNALVKSEDILSAASVLEHQFLGISNHFRGLGGVAEGEGLRGFELQVTNRFLEYAAESHLHPLLNAFFVRIINARNILSLFKYVSLGSQSAPPFIRGGDIAEKNFTEIIGKREMSDVNSLLFTLTGRRIARPHGTEVEVSLYVEMTRFLRKAGRDPSGIAPLLDYLWRCSVEVMNLGVLVYGKDFERDALKAELVR